MKNVEFEIKGDIPRDGGTMIFLRGCSAIGGIVVSNSVVRLMFNLRFTRFLSYTKCPVYVTNPRTQVGNLLFPAITLRGDNMRLNLTAQLALAPSPYSLVHFDFSAD